jgi:signal peptidase II
MSLESGAEELAKGTGLKLGLSVAVVAFALDRFNKWWLLDYFDMPSRGHVELAPFFNLVMVWNRGVSFGLFSDGGQGHRLVLTAISVVIVGVLFYWLQRTSDRLPAIAYGLIIGGAVGNIYDRFSYGAVADFFDVHMGQYHWPAFNIADSAITIGVGLILLEALLSYRKPQS